MTTKGKRVCGKLGAARYTFPLVQDVEQDHAVELLDPVRTAGGETLPAGTRATVLSRGNCDGRKSARLSLWGSGRQVDVYTDAR